MERIYKMSLRESLQKNPVAALIVVVVLVGIAVLIVMRGNSAPSGGNTVYFYDLGSGQLFHAAADAVPPIDSPSGANLGVGAAVFACGDCAAEGDRFIAYLQTLEPSEIEGEMRSLIAPVPDGGEPQWVSSDSRAAGALIQQPAQRCGTAPDQQPVACKP